MPRRITFVGELNQYCGYGGHSLEIVRFLQAKGFYVSIRALGRMSKVPEEIRPHLVYSAQPEEKEILLTPPHVVPTTAKKTIYFTMWESTRLLPFSAEYLNRAHLVVVPNKWNRDCFMACGVKRPIHIVPLGIDPAIYNYRPMNMEGPCVFGAAGNLKNGSRRKGVMDVVKVFQSVFPTEADVRLRIKCLPGCNIDGPQDERIELVKQMLTDDELADWYQSLTAFCSFARAEGWGLMQHQALGIGRPVIAASYGGLAEFLDSSVGYPVNFKEVPADEVWKDHGVWCEPDFGHFGDQMRKVYNDRAEAERLGEAGSLRAVGLSWDNSNSQLLKLYEAM